MVRLLATKPEFLGPLRVVVDDPEQLGEARAQVRLLCPLRAEHDPRRRVWLHIVPHSDEVVEPVAASLVELAYDGQDEA